MTVDWALIISFAALVLSIASPLISACLQRKTKEIELKAEAERRREEFYNKHRAEVRGLPLCRSIPLAAA